MARRLEVPLDRNQGQSALQVISAWASDQRLVLAQLKVEDKSNEITAIPALLELLDLTGAIITGLNELISAPEKLQSMTYFPHLRIAY